MTLPGTLSASGSPTARLEWPSDKLCLVDVGGAGGVQEKWRIRADQVSPILFEPNPVEAAKLRDSLKADFAHSLVVESGLSHIAGTQQLNITQYWGCTSLRRPNREVLSRYRIAPLFEVVATTPVACTRYDALYYAGQVPAPDVIKIDVQGFEYEVLQGFGSLLQTSLGIELEAHLYPIYQGQKLLHHLVSLLADFGFVVRKLSPVPNFDGDVVELDVWFTKNILDWRQLGPPQAEKFRIICETWDLVEYGRVNPSDPHNYLAPA